MRPDRGRWWRLLCTIIILFLVLHPYLLRLCVLHPRRCSYCVQGLHCKNLTQAHHWDGGGGTTTVTAHAATQDCVLTASYNWPPVRDPALIREERKVTVALMGTGADLTGMGHPKKSA